MSGRGPVVGIVLAAGRGRRFDARGARDKLLARIDGGAVVDLALRALSGSCDRLIAVVRDDAAGARVRAAVTVPNVDFVACADADRGMGHSLACGARAVLGGPAPAAVVVLPGDMPFVRPDTVAAVLAALGDAGSISAPTHAGQRGHPVAFGGVHLEALTLLTGDQGARGLLRSQQPILVPTDDAGTIRDIDLPADLPEPDGTRAPGAQAGPSRT